MCLAETAHFHKPVARRDFLKLAGAAVAAPFLLGQAERKAGAASLPRKRAGYGRVAGLSHVLAPETPIWPGMEPIKIVPVRSHEKDGFYLNQWTLVEHQGTHLDAPIHFVRGKWSVEELPDEALICPAAVIDIREKVKKSPDAQLTPEDLKAWEAKHGRIPSGAAVLMLSGWDQRIHDQAMYRNQDDRGGLHFPGFHSEAVGMLLQERRINGIGVDTLSLDHGPSKDFAAHLKLLGANRWGLENLTHLSAIPPAGATLFVGVPKVQGASGGPAQVIAVW